YTSVVTAPTCEEEGYTTYTCGCGETYTDDYVAALGHDWDAGVITKKPTATEAGEMTYTCSVCGETKTEEIAALGSHEALIKLDVATDVKAQKVTGAAAYDAAASKAIAEYVKALGGTITKLGLKMTVNGETLDAPLSITVDYFNAMLNGLDLSAYAPAAYYAGMNVNQMSTVVTFVSYCEYVDANGETQVLEGVAVDYTFDQYLAENSEDPDVQLIVAMKDAAANAADVEKAGAETKVENGPAIESTYNLKDLSVSATFSYTADDMNKLALAAQDAGNVITGLGFKVTWANGEETSVAAISEDYWNYMLSTGFAFSADAFLKGMNLEEMGGDVTFTAYYTCANGEVVIGEQTVKFIDLISGDADAAAYVNAYNGLIA
ncbi:MAG: hypothetical protein IJD55_00860, partial [Clostridia bacterium]|nr:hypothetical protein [Clostridia bacterium]